MNLMVTGATGFVGQHVVASLLGRGHHVVAVARDEARARKQNWFERVHFVACDVHAPLSPSLLDQTGCSLDATIHLAWPGLPNYGALQHIEETLPAQYRFLKSLVEGGVRRLLVTGTCFEYGMQNGSLSEEMPSSPANPYALAKDVLRKCLQQLQHDRPFTLQWARLFYTYGPGQNPNSLLAQLDRAIDAGEATFDMSGGEQLRDYLPIEDVASRLAALVEHPHLDGIINICSGKPVSVRRLVERHAAARNVNIRLNLDHYPYSPYEPMAFWGNPGKFVSATTED